MFCNTNGKRMPSSWGTAQVALPAAGGQNLHRAMSFNGMATLIPDTDDELFREKALSVADEYWDPMQRAKSDFVAACKPP